MHLSHSHAPLKMLPANSNVDTIRASTSGESLVAIANRRRPTTTKHSFCFQIGSPHIRSYKSDAYSTETAVVAARDSIVRAIDSGDVRFGVDGLARYLV